MSYKGIRVFIIIVILAITITGVLAIVVSYLPFGIVRENISIIRDWQPEFYQVSFQLRLRFIGIVILLLSGIFWFEIQKLYLFLNKIFKKLELSFKSENKLHIFVLIAIALLAIAVRVFFINMPLRSEEAFSFVNYVEKPFFAGLINYSTINNFPLNTFLTIINYLIFGQHEWALRLSEIIFGILFIPFFYITTRIFFNKNTALISTAIISASPIFIYYSVNFSGFMLISFYFICILGLAKYLKDNYDILSWLCFSFIASLGLIVSPLFLYPLFFVIIWLLLSLIFKDTKLSKTFLLRNIILYSTVIIVLTFIFYMPFLTSVGLAPLINFNFSSYNSQIETGYVLIGTFKSAWSQWNLGIYKYFSILFLILALCSLFIHKKISRHKIPIILSSLVLVIPFIFIKRITPFGEIWLFLLPVLIMMASAATGFLLNLVFIKIKKKNVVISIFSIILSAILIITIFINKPVEEYNSGKSLKDAGVIASDLKEILESGDRIITPEPFDNILEFYLKQKNVPVDYLRSYLNATNKLYIVLKKNTSVSLEDFLKDYFNSDNIESYGFINPIIYKEYESAYIYKAESILPESESILDLSSFKNAVFENCRLSDDGKSIIFDEGRTDLLKRSKIPVALKNNTDYLISFEIKKIEDLNNTIYLDFMGSEYDNPEQEFILRPTDIYQEFVQIKRIINTENIPRDITVYFRIFTTSVGEIEIKNLEIYEIFTNEYS